MVKSTYLKQVDFSSITSSYSSTPWVISVLQNLFQFTVAYLECNINISKTGIKLRLDFLLTCIFMPLQRSVHCMYAVECTCTTSTFAKTMCFRYLDCSPRNVFFIFWILNLPCFWRMCLILKQIFVSIDFLFLFFWVYV